jgi:dephospho-CoA kinase
MRTLPDTELQARLLRESIQVNEKKRELEENLRTADVRSKLLIDSAARKDIEAYKNRHGVAEVAYFATMTADNVRKQI